MVVRRRPGHRLRDGSADHSSRPKSCDSKRPPHTKAGLLAWILEINLDTTLPLVLLAVAPFCGLFVAGPTARRSAWERRTPACRCRLALGDGRRLPVDVDRRQRVDRVLRRGCQARSAVRRFAACLSRRIQLSLPGEDVPGGQALVPELAADARTLRSDARRERRPLCQPLFPRRRTVDRAVSGDRPSLLGRVAGRGFGGVFHLLGGTRAGRQRRRPDGGSFDRSFTGNGTLQQPASLARTDDGRSRTFPVCLFAIHADGPIERRLLGRLRTELRHALPSDDGGRLRPSLRPVVRLALCERPRERPA